jgi:hypothetical protein
LPVTPAGLTTHTFNLATLAARNGGRADTDQLFNALRRNIRDAVAAAEPGLTPQAALARAELRLEAGEPGLVAVGLEVAQRAAQGLNHRILFASGPGANLVNICP